MLIFQLLTTEPIGKMPFAMMSIWEWLPCTNSFGLVRHDNTSRSYCKYYILYIIDNEYNGAIWECMHGCHLYICILTVLDCLDIILPEVLGLNRHTKHAPLYILTMNGACFVCLFYTGLVTSPSSHRWSSLFLPCEGLHVQEQLHLCSLVQTAGFSYSRDVLFAFISKYNYIN